MAAAGASGGGGRGAGWADVGHRRLSRDLEDQADRVGLRYAFEAEYDVRAGESLWTKFLQKYGQQSRLANVLAGSHSRPSDRIRNVAREITRNDGG